MDLVLDSGSGIKPILGSPETHLFVAEIIVIAKL